MNKQLRKSANSILKELRACYCNSNEISEDEMRSLLEEFNGVLDENEANLDNYPESFKNSDRIQEQMSAQDDMRSNIQTLTDYLDSMDELDLSEVDNLLDELEQLIET